MKGVIVVTASLVVVGTAHAQSLQEQAQCAALAQKAFRQDAQEWDRENEQTSKQMKLPPYDSISFAYEGHYNAKIHRCLILTSRKFKGSKGEVTTAMSLYDVIERHYYASYVDVTNIPGVLCDTNPKRDCNSIDESEKIVKEYMEEE
jgi:hypothetical protein